MATKLKNLTITSTDLVNAGANPDAHIHLFKHKGGTGGTGESSSDTLIQKIATALAGVLPGVFGKSNIPETSVAKDAQTFDDEMQRERLCRVTGEAWNYCYAFSDSLSSIICDNDLDEEEKREMMFQSLDEFAETLRNAIPNWAAGKTAATGDETVEKSAPQQAAFEELMRKYAGDGNTATVQPESELGRMGDQPDSAASGTNDNGVEKSHEPQEEVTADMEFNKSKMTPEELATLADFEKKYGIVKPEGTDAGKEPAANGVAKSAEPPAENNAASVPKLHPEVKKALDANKALAEQVLALTKSLEIKDLTAMAKKYEIIGKKAEELAPKLYELKKVGGTAYDDYVALLDEQMTLVDKGGLFAEFGKNRSGSPGTGTELEAKAAEIRKNDNKLSFAEAFAKAYEENPELAAKYDADYSGGRA